MLAAVSAAVTVCAVSARAADDPLADTANPEWLARQDIAAGYAGVVAPGPSGTLFVGGNRAEFGRIPAASVWSMLAGLALVYTWRRYPRRQPRPQAQPSVPLGTQARPALWSWPRRRLRCRSEAVAPRPPQPS